MPRAGEDLEPGAEGPVGLPALGAPKPADKCAAVNVHDIEPADALVRIDDVEAPREPGCAPGEPPRVEVVGLAQGAGHPVEDHAFGFMVPLLRKDMHLVGLGQTPRHLHGVTLRSAGGDVAANENGNLHSRLCRKVISRNEGRGQVLIS